MKSTSLTWLLSFFFFAISPVGLIAYADQQNTTGKADSPPTKTQNELIWQEPFDSTPRSWNEADTYCQSLGSNGHRNWRLPSILEIKSLVKTTDLRPDGQAINAFDLARLKYWSQQQDQIYSDCAWCVDIINGYVSLEKLTMRAPARCIAEVY